MTRSSDFPTTPGAFDRTFEGLEDVFVTKLNPTGSALVYSTFLGGDGNESAYGITVDAAGHAYVTGITNSPDFPTANALQPAFGGLVDAFVTKLNPTGSALVYSTFLGGSDGEVGVGVAVDAAGDAYVMGWTRSSNFPTTGMAFQRALAGDEDGFIAKIAVGAQTYTLTVAKAGTGSDTVTSSPAGIDCGTTCSAAFSYATSVTLTATPATGSIFTGWSGEGCTGTGTCTVSMTQDRAVTATFELQATITVTTSPPGLQIAVDGQTYTAPQTFNWVPGSTHTLGTSSPQYGSPGTRYVFSAWSDGGAQTHTVTAPTGATTYTATFVAQYELTIIMSPAMGGTVTVTPSGDLTGVHCIAVVGVICAGYYASGTPVTLTATPEAGYVFTGWSGDLTGTQNPATLTMTGPKTVTATFTLQIPTLSLSVNQPSFRRGETLSLTTTVTPGSTSTTVDAYVAIALPGGPLLFLQGDGNFTTDVRPIVTNWTVAPFSGEIFRYTFSGGEPLGSYTWYAAFAVPGGNPLFGTIGLIVSAPFSFSP